MIHSNDSTAIMKRPDLVERSHFTRLHEAPKVSPVNGTLQSNQARQWKTTVLRMTLRYQRRLPRSEPPIIIDLIPRPSDTVAWAVHSLPSQ